MPAEVLAYYPENMTNPRNLTPRCTRRSECLELRKSQDMYASDREGEYRALHRKADE